MQKEIKKTAKEVIADIKALLKRIKDRQDASNKHDADKQQPQ